MEITEQEIEVVSSRIREDLEADREKRKKQIERCIEKSWEHLMVEVMRGENRGV